MWSEDDVTICDVRARGTRIWQILKFRNILNVNKYEKSVFL